jgi:ribonucleoside-diphosphate reductase alpha chain
LTTTYSYNEVRNASVSYFGGDELPADVFAGKYALQDLKGTLYEKTPDEMHERVAREFHRAECKYVNPTSFEEIKRLLTSWEVVPQGGPLSAIGNPFQVQSLSNCFVIQSPHDSYGGIMKTDQEQVQIMKRRGGVGFDLSTIRPRGLPAANAARTTDGIGVFMERYSNTCREVAQGGRRGALMLTISIHHPEVLMFANIKRDRKKVTGANVSFRVTNEFMDAVKEGKQYQQRFPVDSKPGQYVIERWVDAREVWNNIVAAMRDCSEPGMLFWDQVEKMGPADAYRDFGYGSISTNPCGEITLSAYDSCRLLLMNLSKFVNNPFTQDAVFDFKRFDRSVYFAQRLMDDLIDLELEAVDRILLKIENDPEPKDVKCVEHDLWTKIKNAAINGRRTGLGITALGDTFAMCNLKYGSDDSITLTDRIYQKLAVTSYRSSVDMAMERGPFPIFSHEIEKGHPFIERIMNEDADLRRAYEQFGRRNIANTTTAPAGSMSIMTQTTSGCEPVLFIKSRRKRKITEADKNARIDETDALGDQWQYYDLVHQGFTKWMQVTGKSVVEESPYFGSTVEEIDWLKKIDIQAAAQKWICHSISNTTNLPKDVSVETVEKLCWHGWETGCKGVTIYRIGSRDAVIVDEAATSESGQPLIIVETHAPKRPKEMQADVHRVQVDGVKYLVLVGTLHDKPYEIFAGLSEHVEVPRKSKTAFIIKNGKKDGVATYNLRIPLGDDDELLLKDIVSLFDNPLYGAFTRTISLALRHGVPVQYLVEQLRKDKHSNITSFSSIIARVLKGYIVDGTKANTSEKRCPECGGETLVYQQGCVSCLGGVKQDGSLCGWSKC